MIDLVLPEQRMVFAGALMQMHRDRKQVFVDRLGWDLPAPGSWLEIDEYDDEYAVYMLARGNDGTHRGSVRLLPTTRPHMLAGLFRSLCAADPPAHSGCWEISRLVTSPAGASGTSVLRVHRLLALALVEFATSNDITAYSLVIEANRLPALLSVGWLVRPLGLPAMIHGQELQALEILIKPDTLAAMRAKLNIHHPVIRVPEHVRRAA